jgi:uncharacterized protein (DUF486 family)
MRVGVIGIGGLGHLAIQFAKAMGCEVTAFSSSENKQEEAITLVVFSLFSIFYLKEEFKWNYAVGFLMIVSAVFVIFRKW